MHAIVFTIAHTAIWSLRAVFAGAITLKAIARSVSKLKVEARSCPRTSVEEQGRIKENTYQRKYFQKVIAYRGDREVFAISICYFMHCLKTSTDHLGPSSTKENYE